MEPLQIYLASVTQSAGLNDRGRSILKGNLSRLLQNRLHIQRAVETDSGLINRSLQNPLFILGMPRTGSTLLHQLLACDPAARAIKYYEGVTPVPPVDLVEGDEDPRIKAASRQLNVLNRVAPDLPKVHASYPTAPEECLRIMEHSFADTMLEIRTRAPEYSAWLKDHELDPVYYEEFRTILNVLGMNGQQRHWVCKSPRHMLSLPSLLEVFPEAKIIWTHRNPIEAIPSFCSLSDVVRQVSTDEVDKAELGKFWLDRIASGMELALACREADQPQRYIDVQYSDLLNDPIGMVKKIYSHHGYTYTEEFEAAMVTWLEDHPQNKYGKHTYSPEKYGLSSAIIEETFGQMPTFSSSDSGGTDHQRLMATHPITVTSENFVQAETARMFDSILLRSTKINRWTHRRELTSSANQNVVRMNRDTLYSGAVVDAVNGFTLQLPDPAGRYMSAAIVNESHHVEQVLHGPGQYTFAPGVCESEHVAVILRTFVDPSDASDIKKAHALQNSAVIEATTRRPFKHPTFDRYSRQKIADDLKVEAQTLSNTNRMFGTRTDVDTYRHLLGTASGWGGLPETEAYYVFDTEPRPVGHYIIKLAAVPVEGFWSFTVYNRDGYLEKQTKGCSNKNSVTAQSPYELQLTPNQETQPNYVHVVDGWNYVLRLYKPRPEVLDGSWLAPRPEPL